MTSSESKYHKQNVTLLVFWRSVAKFLGEKYDYTESLSEAS